MGSAVFLSSRMVVSGPEDDAWGNEIDSTRMARVEHLREQEGETIGRAKAR